MNKYILYTRISLFMLLILPFVFLPMTVLSTNGFFLICFYSLNTVLWVLFFMEKIKNKNYMKISDLHNLLILIASIYFLILLVHGFYDTFIIIKNMYSMMYSDSDRLINFDSSFINNNISTFVTLHSSFIVYDAAFGLLKPKNNNSFKSR